MKAKSWHTECLTKFNRQGRSRNRAAAAKPKRCSIPSSLLYPEQY